MNSISLATLFLADWALPWVVVLTVAAWITGARSLAATAAAVVMADVIFAPLLAPIIGGLPDWAVLPLLGVFAMIVLNQVLTALFGPETAGNVTASLLLGTVRMVVLLPFRIIRFVLHLGTRGW